ncbi:MAG: ABC transporter permease [Gemmatimonadota bacterium]|nr:ABC transporter permease [Gemmatimonadota bacterium]
MIGVLLLTLRELLARKVVLGLFLVATLVWGMLALALQLDVVEGTLQGIRLFGQAPEIRTEHGEGIEGLGDDPLRMIVVTAQAFVAVAAYWVGILLALFATGGLVASLMERGRADLLLSKPLGRARILGGRLLGVGVVTALLSVYLLGMVWLVMSLKSGVWNPGFLLGIGVVFAMFAVVYAIVALVSVWTESSALALVVTLGVLFATIVLAIPGLADRVGAPWDGVVETLHVVLPRFPEVGAYTLPDLARGKSVDDWVPLASSLAFGAVAYAATFWLFRRKDF